MTGYGRGEARTRRVAATAEIRGVNSRFLEVSTKLPASLGHTEVDVKEIVRSRISRGKVNVVITLERPEAERIPLRVNKGAAKAYHKLLGDLQKTLKLQDRISLLHVLKFSEVFEPITGAVTAEEEWEVVERATTKAMDAFNAMRRKEGAELKKDLRKRVELLRRNLDAIQRFSRQHIPEHRERLQQRLQDLLQDKGLVDSSRLDLEIALLADKLDVTEECVRFRSHNKLFIESLADGEAVGRKLNFLVQEMNREANTIGSKAGDAQITHLVVQVKEELEKIREQLQNIE